MLAFPSPQNNARKCATALLRIRLSPSWFAVSTIQRTGRARWPIVSTFWVCLRRSTRPLCAGIGVNGRQYYEGVGSCLVQKNAGTGVVSALGCAWLPSKAARIGDAERDICDNEHKVGCKRAKLVCIDRRRSFYNLIYMLMTSCNAVILFIQSNIIFQPHKLVSVTV